MAAYMARDGYKISYAIGSDLTAWDNAQVKLAAAEINAMDWFIGASVVHTKPKTININPMASSHYQKRVTVGRYTGIFSTTHYLQTAILTYAVMGASTAVAGPNERDITKDTDEVPINLAFHLEKEGTNTSRRTDIMGIVPNELTIQCSETSPIARQTYRGEFAYSNLAPADDLAQPTDLVQATHPPYTWSHYKNSSGSSAFTYNTGAINVDIVGFSINFGWSKSTFGNRDGNFYPQVGYTNPPFITRVTLECMYKDAGGTDVQTISDLDHASYAGDLDLIVEFYEDATNYIEYTFDDMFIDPDSFEETFVSEGDWFDGFRFDLVFRNETSSLAVKSKDALADTYYTNP
jgi:hypothetical protein